MKKIFCLIILCAHYERNVLAAEAGMPQLDPAYWPSQAFWLIVIFSLIYILISKIFIPKIKSNLDLREDKIRKDLEEAKMLKEESEKKLKKYNSLIETGKIEVKKIISDGREKLNNDIQQKRREIEEEIEKETKNAEKEIINFKKNSINKISSISEEIASNLVKDIFGESPNASSVKATISQIVKDSKI